MFMKTAILTVIVLFNLALCVDLPAPVHLDLSSKNFVHELYWEMGPGTPDGVHYTVIIRRLSKGSVVVKACENVTAPLWCNLTEAISDVKETYYISVFAALGSRISNYSNCSAFKPSFNTTLDPPLLTVTACNQTLCVSLRAPAEKLYNIYNDSNIQYRLYISSESGEEFHVDTKGLQNVTLEHLAIGQRYCVTVSNPNRSLNSQPVCVSTLKRADFQGAVISIILYLLIVLLLMCIPRFVSCSLCLRRDLPKVLRPFEGFKKVLLITSGEPISILYVERDTIQKMETNGEEKQTEGEAEEDVRYERLVTQYLDPQGSTHSIIPIESSADFLVNQSADKHISLTSSTDSQSCNTSVYGGGVVYTDEPKASPRSELSPFQKLSSVVPTHVEKEDRESIIDINLFSVTLRGVSAQWNKADPDQTCSSKDELGSCSQSLLQTDATSNSDLQFQKSESNEMLNSEEEDCGYLNRN